jgi:hypothetical protein
MLIDLFNIYMRVFCKEHDQLIYRRSFSHQYGHKEDQ